MSKSTSSTPSVQDILSELGLDALGENPPPDAIANTTRAVSEWRSKGAHPVDVEVVGIEFRKAMKAAGVDRVAALWDTTAPRRGASEDAGQGRALTLSDPEPWPEPVEGAGLLADLVEALKRFVVLPVGAAVGLGLWIIHSYTHDAAETSPLMAVTSPTPRAGKTTLFSLLTALARRALPASSVSSSSIYRAIEAMRPTLLIDEADALGRDEGAEFKRIMRSMHTKVTACVIRTDKDTLEVRAWSTWAPVAVALIGDLGGALADRGIEIRMRRRLATEPVERLRMDQIHRDLEPLRRQALRWSIDYTDELRDADPEVPEQLHDRAADCWRPLLAIADAAGGSWPERARRAALALSGIGEPTDDDAGSLLLSDMRTIFNTRGVDQLRTKHLREALIALGEDRPWGEWRRGEPVSPRSIARLLNPYQVRPRDLRTPDGTQKGYRRKDLTDVWERYLPALPPPEHPRQARQSNDDRASGGSQIRDSGAGVADGSSGEDPSRTTHVVDVADGGGGIGSEGVPVEVPELWGTIAEGAS